jgi:hypothetical protein
MKKLKNNVHIERTENGFKLYSYTTLVAENIFNKLIVNGKYSRATSQQISWVAKKFNLEVQYISTEQKSFYQLPFGVNIKM